MNTAIGNSASTAQDVSKDLILKALSGVIDPDLQRDIVALGFVKNLKVCGGQVGFDIELTTPACPVKEVMRDQAHKLVQAVPGVETVTINMTAQVRGSSAGLRTHGGMAKVKTCIAVASGKGGVGKSTVAANLALAMAKTGARVGLMDADIYGPSVARMLGGEQRPTVSEKEGMLNPLEKFGVKFISMGLLVGKDTPVIWRGPMATRLIQQFLDQVDWGDLDYLFIDLPPGTGDVQLTLTQSAPLTGAVIVTTPQDVAVGITTRGLKMFEQVQVPILGIVENMSGFLCPHCGGHAEIFKQGGGKRAAEDLGVPFLGEIPLDARIADAGDAGEPVVNQSNPKAAGHVSIGERFEQIAGKLAQQISVVTHNSSAVRFYPKAVGHENGLLKIVWSDDHKSEYPFRQLRLACPCAVCIDEWTGEKRLDPKQVPQEVAPVDYAPVGRYALQIRWSDGHKTGIYTFDKLRALDLKAPQS